MSFIKYLREVSEEDIEKINHTRDLHFGNIFGEKLRIVIPLEQDENINKLISKLEELGYEVDYEDLINKKQAYKRIKTQQGEKLRPEKVGKILQTSNSRELLDWWQKNSENLKNREVGSSIIISRSPIDVLRMSDHDGISSCHSPDGSFYKCAKQEARTGGAIAYVVKNSDLKGINIQDKEIFEDPDRNVDGIVPLERLRLRRLTDGNLDLLIPELRTYGIKNVGFLNAVKNWAKSSQKSVIEKLDPVESYKSFKLKGGSYQDTDMGRVWSGFFDVAVSGGKKSQDEDEESEDDSDIYERAQETLQNHQSDWKHIFVSLDESEGYLVFDAYGSFRISEKLFTVEIGDYRDSNYKKVKRIVEDAIDINGIDNIQIEHDNNSRPTTYEFRFTFRDEGYAGDDQLVNFEHFLDYVDDVDRDFEEHVGKVQKALLDEGYIKDLSERVEFKNFDVELDDESFTLTTKEPEKIGYLKDYTIAKNNISMYGQAKVSAWNKEFPSYINQFKVLPFKVSKDNFELFIDRNAVSYPQDDDRIYASSDNTNPKNLARINGWVYFNVTINLNIDLYKNAEAIKRIKNLDNNWDFYISKLAKLFDMFIKNKQAISPLTGYPVSPASQKQLAQKPVFKKPPTQLKLNFKDWFLNSIN